MFKSLEKGYTFFGSEGIIYGRSNACFNEIPSRRNTLKLLSSFSIQSNIRQIKYKNLDNQRINARNVESHRTSINHNDNKHLTDDAFDLINKDFKKLIYVHLQIIILI